MDEPDFVVKHFVACSRIEGPALADPPYTLHEVRYVYTVPADREWPVRLDELWLFVRFYNGSGTRWLTASLHWLDDPSGAEQEVCAFAFVVRFPDDRPVLSRGWNISAVRYPGPGQYVFRLTDDLTGLLLADEYVTIGRET